jgi:hypothetical protein
MARPHPSPPASGLLVVLLAGAVLAGCSRLQRVERTQVGPADVATLDSASPFLKAHLRGGSVYVLSDWQVESGAIVGSGALLDHNRDPVATGTFRFPADSALLFETNVVHATGARSAITVMVGITAAVAGVCATNPKACFGSCPTFYAPDSTGASALLAEGFSASIAPALEATDLDMLQGAAPRSGQLTLRVTNEALETHVIRHMDVLAAPRPPGGRVFTTGAQQFREAYRLHPPAACDAPEGDCRSVVSALDRQERWSVADSADLGTRETVELRFDGPLPRDVGLVITTRQTLLTTFLIYQALAYLGNDAGRFLAALETGGTALRDGAAAMGRALGQIEVLLDDGAGGWQVVGRAGETGPLASDTWLVPLPHAPAGGRVRLRMTRGLWRLDQVALAELGASVTPVRVRPHAVLRDGSPDAAALASLLDPAATLVTLPGDAYDVRYAIPGEAASQELFLEARGYYLEWMRQEWLAEQDGRAALRMLRDPAGMLRALAPAYKRAEAQQEAIFWGSRYVRP